jgi:hypothetical protein
MTRVQNAIQRIYEDADLRDELTDDEAAQMLKWAEGELSRLDASGAEDAAFEAKLDALLSLLRKMNRFAGRQGQLSAQADAQSNDQATGSIAALASELGHPADAAQVAAAGTGDPSGTITALIALLSSASTTQVTPVSPTATQPQPSVDTMSQADPLNAPSAVDSGEGKPSVTPPTPRDDPSDAPADSTHTTHTSFGDYIDEYDL